MGVDVGVAEVDSAIAAVGVVGVVGVAVAEAVAAVMRRRSGFR